jgi:hypothetical protein
MKDIFLPQLFGCLLGRNHPFLSSITLAVFGFLFFFWRLLGLLVGEKEINVSLPASKVVVAMTIEMLGTWHYETGFVIGLSQCFSPFGVENGKKKEHVGVEEGRWLWFCCCFIDGGWFYSILIHIRRRFGGNDLQENNT